MQAALIRSRKSNSAYVLVTGASDRCVECWTARLKRLGPLRGWVRPVHCVGECTETDAPRVTIKCGKRLEDLHSESKETIHDWCLERVSSVVREIDSGGWSSFEENWAKIGTHVRICYPLTYPVQSSSQPRGELAVPGCTQCPSALELRTNGGIRRREESSSLRCRRIGDEDQRRRARRTPQLKVLRALIK